MNKRIAQGERSREAILEKAEHLFAKKGFNGTSMRDLAGICGTSQALLHHHFGNKLGLYKAMRERLISNYVKSVSMHLIDSYEGLDFFKNLAYMAFRFNIDNPHISRISAWAHLEGLTEVGESTSIAREAGEEIMKRLYNAREQGLLRKDIDPGYIRIIVLASVYYWSHYRDLLLKSMNIEKKEGDPDERFFRQMFDIIMCGAGTGKLREILGNADDKPGCE